MNSAATTEPLSPLRPTASSSLPSSGLPSVAPSSCSSSSHRVTRCADSLKNACSGCNDGDDSSACEKESGFGLLPEASPTTSTAASSSTSPSKRADSASSSCNDDLAGTSVGGSPSSSPTPFKKANALTALDTTVVRQGESSI